MPTSPRYLKAILLHTQKLLGPLERCTRLSLTATVTTLSAREGRTTGNPGERGGQQALEPRALHTLIPESRRTLTRRRSVRPCEASCADKPEELSFLLGFRVELSNADDGERKAKG